MYFSETGHGRIGAGVNSIEERLTERNTKHFTEKSKKFQPEIQKISPRNPKESPREESWCGCQLRRGETDGDCREAAAAAQASNVPSPPGCKMTPGQEQELYFTHSCNCISLISSDVFLSLSQAQLFFFQKMCFLLEFNPIFPIPISKLDLLFDCSQAGCKMRIGILVTM